jgi:hypothetical protein
MLKGAIHIHSTYSDGKFTLRELRDTFLAEGCAFLCMTDHVEYFDESRLQAYREECDTLSDRQFRLVSGLEYACQRDMHILGFGASQLARSKDPQQAIAQIQSENAIAVIAHPKDDAFSWIESFATLPDGIEGWNTKYDGRHAPRPATFGLIERLRLRKPDLKTFYGLDLHWKNQFRGLLIHLNGTANDRDAVLAALAHGEYSAHKGDWELSATRALPSDLLGEFGRTRQRVQYWQRLLRGTGKSLARLGIPIPEAMKDPFRRIF